MQGENIICFSKDWNEDPTSNHHVIIELAKSNRVLWLNSVSTRAPSLGSGRDLRKIARKLADFAAGPARVADNLWVYTPLVLPLPHNPAAVAVNRRILRLTIALLRQRLEMGEFQLWTFLPNVADYVHGLGESLLVYYCVDEWSMFTGLDEQRTAAAERALCGQADVVFAVCQALVDSKRAFNPEVHLATHGVDHALFAAALDPDTRPPEDAARLRRPVLGFYGTVQDWVDQDLIAYLANRHPEWSILLVGQIRVDTSRLASLPNVHLVGRKPHADLPGYCRGFDVGIIPYVINDRMKYVNPIKLREYLSAGLPVVSTAVPEVARYPDLAAVATDFPAFESAVVRAIAGDSAEARRQRSEAMRAETWQRKVAAVGDTVMDVKGRKNR